MRKMPIHKVVRVGMSIYVLCLSIGVCFISKSSFDSKVSKDIVYLVAVEGDSENANEDANAKKRFGAQLMGEEDDDDSAKVYHNHSMHNIEALSHSLGELTTTYSSTNQDISTPPPWRLA